MMNLKICWITRHRSRGSLLVLVGYFLLFYYYHLIIYIYIHIKITLYKLSVMHKDHQFSNNW
jgi:hypothetical protein